MNDSIGHKLRTLRKGRKLTQQDVSEKLGIDRASISNYEIGRRVPNLNVLRRFAEMYGVSLDYFGVAPKDEVFELLARAKEVFENEEISVEAKNELYKEIMKLYLRIK